MAISTRWSPSPVTRPAHSPSIMACPSSSRPSSRKKSIAPPRSSTTIPTLSIRLSAMFDLQGVVPTYKARSLSACNPFQDQLAGLGGIAPAQNLDPFAGLQVFIMREKMLDLAHGDIREVAEILHPVE